MYGTIQDITERKHAEHEKEKLADQLRQSQKLESIGRLAGGVAHDFNNMLNVILGYSELIEDKLDKDNPILSEIQQIGNAGRRARDITRQLLAFSRKQMIAPVTLDLNEHIHNMTKTLCRLIGEHIELCFQPRQDLWTIRFDPSQIDQILVNLSVNARDAMPQGGKLTIETDNITLNEDYCRHHAYFKPGLYVLIGVSDTGAGIDNEVMPQIFEPFFTTKGVGEGTGLGLATVYGIIKQNNGFVTVQSEADQGATFKIYLPCSADVISASDHSEEGAAQTGAESILLVEDNDLVRKVTSSMLESAGYSVIVADDVNDAIAICSDPQVCIDLMITDVVMPQMNGTELWEQVKTARPAMNVLFMSGYTPNVIVPQGNPDERVSFLQKPFNRNDLIQSINDALG